MSMWKSHPEVLYGTYKDKEGLTKLELDTLIKVCIYMCLTEGLTAEKWLESYGYERMDKTVVKRLGLPKENTEDVFANFMNDKVYLIFREALKYRTHINL